MTLPFVTGDGPAYQSVIGDAWLQGRTAYGGASAAIALTAIKAAFPDLPPLRSAQIAFVGPLAGEVTATPVLLRRGEEQCVHWLRRDRQRWHRHPHAFPVHGIA